jgi:AcrR family transcriptional regulator
MSQKRAAAAIHADPQGNPGTTRARILAAAEKLFAEQGYGNVSMPMIASASGITAGAIYKHFESKEELFFMVVQRAVHAVSVAAEGLDLPHVVAQYTTERLKRVRQFAVEMHYASARHPKVKRLLRRSLEYNIGQIREGIVAAQKAGMIDRTLDAGLLASSVMTFIMGLMHMETLLPDLVDEAAWHDFVAGRVAALTGMK